MFTKSKKPQNISGIQRIPLRLYGLFFPCPAFSYAVFGLVLCSLYDYRPDGRSGRLDREKDRDGQRIWRKAGQCGGSAVLQCAADPFFPVLWQMAPRPIWYFLAAVLLVRLAAYVVAAVKFHRFASVHTLLNKLTGGAVFLLPYMLAFSSGVVYLWITCGIAFAASAEELILHLCRKQYKENRKSLFGGKGQGVPTV